MSKLILIISDVYLFKYPDEMTKKYLYKIPSILIKVPAKSKGTIIAIKIGSEASSNKMNQIIWGRFNRCNRTLLILTII